MFRLFIIANTSPSTRINRTTLNHKAKMPISLCLCKKNVTSLFFSDPPSFQLPRILKRKGRSLSFHSQDPKDQGDYVLLPLLAPANRAGDLPVILPISPSQLRSFPVATDDRHTYVQIRERREPNNSPL